MYMPPESRQDPLRLDAVLVLVCFLSGCMFLVLLCYCCVLLLFCVVVLLCVFVVLLFLLVVGDPACLCLFQRSRLDVVLVRGVLRGAELVAPRAVYYLIMTACYCLYKCTYIIRSLSLSIYIYIYIYIYKHVYIYIYIYIYMYTYMLLLFSYLVIRCYVYYFVCDSYCYVIVAPRVVVAAAAERQRLLRQPTVKVDVRAALQRRVRLQAADLLRPVEDDRVTPVLRQPGDLCAVPLDELRHAVDVAAGRAAVGGHAGQGPAGGGAGEAGLQEQGSPCISLSLSLSLYIYIYMYTYIMLRYCDPDAALR